MKLDVETILIGLDGKELKDGTTLCTFKTVALNALLASFPDEQNLSGEDKFKRYQLAMKINANSEVELSVEEAALIKQLVGKGFAPLVVGRMFEMIERTP